MINFDSIPKDKPVGYSLPEEGFHKATIAKTEMKISANGNKYMQAQLKTDGGAVIFDNIFDSDAPALQWKIGRLVTACKLPLVGELSLEDLAKVILNKRIVVDVKHVENEWQGKVTTKAEVDIFSNDIFYPIEEYDALVGTTTPDAPPETDAAY